jgi:copper chaperone NosL
MKQISKTSKLLIILSSISVIACYFLPLWEIRLWAPQYPEGLAMQIWHNALSGDVDVINGLNHYIGMRHIKVEMFPEFSFLRYVIGAFITFGLFVASQGTIRWLKIYVVCIILAGIVALADFYRWGYDYGHNLDTTAPIQIPDMSYQPPVIGYKVLLNFTALSLPASGGWIFVGVGAIALGLLAWEMRKQAIAKKSMVAIATLIVSSFLSSCSVEPVPLNYGKDACYFCKMTLVDSKFGAEVVTKKGKIYKFDDVSCLISFLQTIEVDEKDISNIYFADFSKPNTLVEKEKAFFLQSEQIKSPMASGIAVFSSQTELEKAMETYQGTTISWNELQEQTFEIHGHKH